MRRSWKIYRAFFQTSLSRELEFRANFLAKLVLNTVWILFFVLLLVVIFSHTNSIAGWSLGDSIVLMGSTFLISSLAAGLFFSLVELPESIRLGSLDFIITKPVDPLFWVSLRRFNLDQIGSICAGVVMVVVGAHIGQTELHFLSWMRFSVMIIVGLAIYYAFSVLLNTLAIWFIRIDNLFMLTEASTQIARNPVDIYGVFLQRILTFFLPFAFYGSYPARALLGTLPSSYYGIGLTWALCGLIAVRIFWNFALKSYGSASS